MRGYRKPCTIEMKYDFLPSNKIYAEAYKSQVAVLKASSYASKQN